MDIEIRRNRDLTFTLDGDVNRKAIEELAGRIPPLTEEQRKMLEEGDRCRRELGEKILADMEANYVRDCLGELITKETHEVDCDVEYAEDKDGLQWVIAKQWYVRPKKSEYEK